MKPLTGLTVMNSAGTAVDAHVITGGDNHFTEGGKDYYVTGTSYYSVTSDGVYTLAFPASEMGLFSGSGKMTLNDQDAATISSGRQPFTTTEPSGPKALLRA